MASLAPRVVKLGGSLLDLADLPARFEAWLRANPAGPTLLVVGGGRRADHVRDHHARGVLDERAAHWAAIDSMQASARECRDRFAARFRETAWLESLDVFERFVRGTVGQHAWLDAPWFMREIDPKLPGGPLPESWDATSDSIAARVAVAAGGVELILLKSVDVPEPFDARQAADSGWVDRWFPRAAAGLGTVRSENLRAFRWNH